MTFDGSAPKGTRRVLVVDDDPDSAELLHDQLERLGYAVDCAPDGNRALMMAGTGDYQLLTLDLNLPEYDGVEVLHLLRKRLLLNPIKVVVVTGDVARPRSRELNSDGIDGYLTKPIDPKVLDSEVARVLRETHPS